MFLIEYFISFLEKYQQKINGLDDILQQYPDNAYTSFHPHNLFSINTHTEWITFNQAISMLSNKGDNLALRVSWLYPIKGMYWT